jgi:hypothetical protein
VLPCQLDFAVEVSALGPQKFVAIGRPEDEIFLQRLR